MNKKCPTCELIFVDYKNIKKFCTKNCADKSYIKPRNKSTCKTCNKLFEYLPSSSDGVFCNKICAGHIKQKIKKACAYCSKEFEIWPSLDKKRFCCSRKCFDNKRRGNPTKQNIYLFGTEEQKWERLILMFNKHVIKKDGCWEWNGPINRRGYGKLKWNNKFMTAHRVSYMLHVGTIPEGMFVCHHCDRPECTRPSCLFIGSAQDNVDDMMRKGRGVKGRPSKIKGKLPPNTVIDKYKAIKIKERLLNGDSALKIAQETNISKNIVYAIKYGKTWRHVTID